MKSEVSPEESKQAHSLVIQKQPRIIQGREDFEDQHGPLAPRSTDQAAKFLREQSTDPIKDWGALCLQLQRMARGIPAAAPSALAAAQITPKSERIAKISDLRRGMVAYCDDPNDSNPFGHIFFIAGRDKDGTILCWTNDARGRGSVSVVPFSFFRVSWGDSFQFGATWLNGFDFSDFNKPPAPTHKDFNFLDSRYERVIEELKKVEKSKRRRGADRVADAVHRDIVRMEKRLKNNPR